MAKKTTFFLWIFIAIFLFMSVRAVLASGEVTASPDSPTYGLSSSDSMSELTGTPTPIGFNGLTGTVAANLSATIDPLSLTPTCSVDDVDCIRVSEALIGFQIPTLSIILSFAIRGAFIIAGLLALIFLITGAISWVTSGGNKESVEKARNKITAAVLGILILAGVLAIIVTLEQVVFKQAVCFGISCDLTIPSLLRNCNDPGVTCS